LFSVEGGWGEGFRVGQNDPMSAKIRKLPRGGTVTSVPIEGQLRAYTVSLTGSSMFWVYDFLTEGRVCDRSLFSPKRWKKFFYYDGAGFPAECVDEVQIELSDSLSLHFFISKVANDAVLWFTS
jgi:hypothetical protein